MPSTAGTTPAPVRNSVWRSLTSRSGGKTLAPFLPLAQRRPCFLLLSVLVSSPRRAVNCGRADEILADPSRLDAPHGTASATVRHAILLPLVRTGGLGSRTHITQPKPPHPRRLSRFSSSLSE